MSKGERMSRVDELVEKARKLLVLKATGHTMIRDAESTLDEVRDELVALGVGVDTIFDVPDGEVRFEKGPVTGRRGANTKWLDENYEALPASVREKVDVKQTATVDLGKAPERLAMELSAAASPGGSAAEWLSIDTQNKWPTVGDLETLLPAGMREHAITKQTRGNPVLVFEQRGISIGQNDRK